MKWFRRKKGFETGTMEVRPLSPPWAPVLCPLAQNDPPGTLPNIRIDHIIAHSPPTPHPCRSKRSTMPRSQSMVRAARTLSRSLRSPPREPAWLASYPLPALACGSRDGAATRSVRACRTQAYGNLAHTNLPSQFMLAPTRLPPHTSLLLPPLPSQPPPIASYRAHHSGGTGCNAWQYNAW